MTQQNQQFENFDEWVSNKEWLMKPNPRTGELERPEPGDAPICFDSVGRHMAGGRDFVLAKKAGTFPIRWLWPEQVGGVALFSIGCRALKYQSEVALMALEETYAGDPIVENLRATLLMMDRIGSPSGADGLHRMAIQASLVNEAASIVSTLKEMIMDVEKWKSGDLETWAMKLRLKLEVLEEKADQFRE